MAALADRDAAIAALLTEIAEQKRRLGMDSSNSSHGFKALTEIADVSYQIDRAHGRAEDVSIAFDDPELIIPWPLPGTVM